MGGSMSSWSGGGGGSSWGGSSGGGSDGRMDDFLEFDVKDRWAAPTSAHPRQQPAGAQALPTGAAAHANLPSARMQQQSAPSHEEGVPPLTAQARVVREPPVEMSATAELVCGPELVLSEEGALRLRAVRERERLRCVGLGRGARLGTRGAARIQ